MAQLKENPLDDVAFRIQERLTSATVGPAATTSVTDTRTVSNLTGSSGRPAQLGRRAEPAKLDSDIQAWLVRPTRVLSHTSDHSSSITNSLSPPALTLVLMLCILECSDFTTQKFCPDTEILSRHRNFVPTQKFCPDTEVFSRQKFCHDTEILSRHRNFATTQKFCHYTEILPRYGVKILQISTVRYTKIHNDADHQ